MRTEAEMLLAMVDRLIIEMKANNTWHSTSPTHYYLERNAQLMREALKKEPL